MADEVRILAGGGESGRPRPPLLAIAGVLVALVVAAGIGRATAPDGDPPAPPSDTASRDDGQAARRVGDVAVGFPRTEAGAVAATLNSGATLGDPRVLLDPDKRGLVLALVATDRYARTFTGPGAAALDRAREEPLGRGLTDGARTISLTSPLSYRVVSYDENAARIVSWGVAVVGNDAGLEPVARWATTTTTLRWRDGDWKIDTASSEAGPTPASATSSPPARPASSPRWATPEGSVMRPDLRRALALIAAVLAVVLIGGAVAPAPAQAQSCDDIPSIPGVPNPVQSGCEAITSVPDIVTDPGGAAADVLTAPLDAAGDQVMQGVTKWVANGASWLVGEVGKLIDETTTPRLDSPWFERQYTAMAALAAVLALPLLLLSVVQGVLKRDGQIVVRAAFVQLPAAFVLTAGAVAVVVMFLQLTDEMCGAVSGSVGGDADEFFKDTGKSIEKLAVGPAQGGAPLFAVFLGGLIAAVGAFFVWVELVIRSAAVYVTVLFLPFTFVAMIWPTTARWCRRLVELLFAVIFSKFVIVAIMSLAAAGLGQSRQEDAFQGVLAGAALMVLAAMSPLVLLRLIPLVETAAHTNWRSGAGSQALGPVAGPAAVMRQMTSANWGGSGGGGGLRAAPAAAGAAAGPAGMVGAGGAAAAGAMTGGMRSRAEGIGGQRAEGGSGPDESPRYAAVGGGGNQAARPAAATPGGDASGGGGTLPAPTSQQAGGPQPADPASGGSSSARAQGGPRPMAPPRDLRGPSSDQSGGGGDGR